mmetsp:Transcript_5857/g.22200  ORF Transcript_5857/g.22200 Transcript_5857/m.22200 type:complete len:216 (+) Transcript_5857:12872-13519(+)
MFHRDKSQDHWTDQDKSCLQDKLDTLILHFLSNLHQDKAEDGTNCPRKSNLLDMSGTMDLPHSSRFLESIVQDCLDRRMNIPLGKEDTQSHLLESSGHLDISLPLMEVCKSSQLDMPGMKTRQVQTILQVRIFVENVPYQQQMCQLGQVSKKLLHPAHNNRRHNPVEQLPQGTAFLLGMERTPKKLHWKNTQGGNGCSCSSRKMEPQILWSKWPL